MAVTFTESVEFTASTLMQLKAIGELSFWYNQFLNKNKIMLSEVGQLARLEKLVLLGQEFCDEDADHLS